MSLIIGDGPIENARRLTIVSGLRFKDRFGGWPNNVSAKMTLPAVRSYGWKGRTVKSALKFMENLGLVEPSWRRCKNKFSNEEDTCECGGQWVYFELDFTGLHGYGCEQYGLPAVPAVDGFGRKI